VADDPQRHAHAEAVGVDRDGHGQSPSRPANLVKDEIHFTLTPAQSLTLT